jgi:hypothetical protein
MYKIEEKPKTLTNLTQSTNEKVDKFRYVHAEITKHKMAAVTVIFPR